jgi:hypothetical protein
VTRRALATLFIAGLWMVGLAGSASAHSVSGMGATNWKTTLAAVTPPVPGLTATVVENGSRIEVTNLGPEILIFGYQGEPYLRVGPGGVFANTRSPAAYLNCSRAGCPVPPEADAQASPTWTLVSTGQTALWHDHRTHWMGSQLPPEVAAAPGQVHVQATWAVTMRQGATDIAATGDYTWIPGHSPFPWLALAAGLLAAGLALALSGRLVLMAVVLAGLIAIDVYHAFGVAWFWAGDPAYRVAQLLEGNSFAIPGWILGVIAVRQLCRRQGRGLYAAAVAGLSTALFTGLLDFTVLSRSGAPFRGPLALDRISVAVALGLGSGVALGALIAARARRPRYEYDFDDSEDAQSPPVSYLNEIATLAR